MICVYFVSGYHFSVLVICLYGLYETFVVALLMCCRENYCCECLTVSGFKIFFKYWTTILPSHILLLVIATTWLCIRFGDSILY